MIGQKQLSWCKDIFEYANQLAPPVLVCSTTYTSGGDSQFPRSDGRYSGNIFCTWRSEY